jgi:hypothetical protein
MYATSPEYRARSHEQRILQIRALRESMANQLTLPLFKRLGQGEIYHCLFQLGLRQRLSQTGLPEADCDHILHNMESVQSSETVVHELAQLSGDSVSYWTDLVHDLERSLLQDMKHSIQYEWFDTWSIEFTAHLFKHTFVFFNEDGTPYPLKMNTPYTYVILLCWLDQSHYELIGERLNYTAASPDLPEVVQYTFDRTRTPWIDALMSDP